MASTTTTLTPTLIDTIRDLIAYRDSAVEDLALMPDHKIGTTWAADRIREVDHANRAIERRAGQLGMAPAELIDACR